MDANARLIELAELFDRSQGKQRSGAASEASVLLLLGNRFPEAVAIWQALSSGPLALRTRRGRAEFPEAVAAFACEALGISNPLSRRGWDNVASYEQSALASFGFDPTPSADRPGSDAHANPSEESTRLVALVDAIATSADDERGDRCERAVREIRWHASMERYAVLAPAVARLVQRHGHEIAYPCLDGLAIHASLAIGDEKTARELLRNAWSRVTAIEPLAAQVLQVRASMRLVADGALVDLLSLESRCCDPVLSRIAQLAGGALPR